jgi:hypothetical protein
MQKAVAILASRKNVQSQKKRPVLTRTRVKPLSK